MFSSCWLVSGAVCGLSTKILSSSPVESLMISGGWVAFFSSVNSVLTKCGGKICLSQLKKKGCSDFIQVKYPFSFTPIYVFALWLKQMINLSELSWAPFSQIMQTLKWRVYPKIKNTGVIGKWNCSHRGPWIILSKPSAWKRLCLWVGPYFSGGNIERKTSKVPSCLFKLGLNFPSCRRSTFTGPEWSLW